MLLSLFYVFIYIQLLKYSNAASNCGELTQQFIKDNKDSEFSGKEACGFKDNVLAKCCLEHNNECKVSYNSGDAKCDSYWSKYYYNGYCNSGPGDNWIVCLPTSNNIPNAGDHKEPYDRSYPTCDINNKYQVKQCDPYDLPGTEGNKCSKMGPKWITCYIENNGKTMEVCTSETACTTTTLPKTVGTAPERHNTEDIS